LISEKFGLLDIAAGITQRLDQQVLGLCTIVKNAARGLSPLFLDLANRLLDGRRLLGG
jgi:hypothetical protein